VTQNQTCTNKITH